MRSIIWCVVALGLMGWGDSFAAVDNVQTTRSQQVTTPSATDTRSVETQRSASDTFRSGTQSNINQRDVTPGTTVRTDTVSPGDRAFTDRTFTERQAFVDRDRAGGSAFMVRFRETLRTDPALVSFAEKIDAIECGNRVILFGVVNSQQIKSNLELKAKNLSGTNVENRIMVI